MIVRISRNGPGNKLGERAVPKDKKTMFRDMGTREYMGDLESMKSLAKGVD